MVGTDLRHARVELQDHDLVGVVGVLSPRGSAALHDGEDIVHLPQATAVAFAGQGRAPMVLAPTTVKWRWQMETMVRTLMVRPFSSCASHRSKYAAAVGGR